MPLIGFAFGPAAAAFLDRLPAGKLRSQIVKKAKALHTDPHPRGCKKLVDVTSGDDAVWRVRVGDYRILYLVRPTEIIVLDIGNRKDIYR
jgi:mRNA interferase RelE/StbE